MDDDVEYARNESRFSGTDKRKVRARLTDCGRKGVFLSMVGGEGRNWPYSLYGVRFATCRIRYSHSKKSLLSSSLQQRFFDHGERNGWRKRIKRKRTLILNCSKVITITARLRNVCVENNYECGLWRLKTFLMPCNI